MSNNDDTTGKEQDLLEGTMDTYELTAHDRCDSNRVEQARVVWTMPDTKGDSGEPLILMFCKHHSEKFGPGLMAQEFKAIADTREELTKRAVGAEVS